MGGFSKQIKGFLKNIVDQTEEKENLSDILQPMGKSIDSISPGDLLIMRYVESQDSILRRKKRGDLRGARPQRIVLVVGTPTPIITQRSRKGRVYSRKINYGSNESWYVNSPMSGSERLIPCVDVDAGGQYSLEDLENLYINRGNLSAQNYRSYRWRSMYQIYRINL